jgi:hypothetical protein
VAVGNTAKLSYIFVGGGNTCFPVALVCLVLTLKMVLSFALPCKDRVEEVNALTPKKCGMRTRRRDPFECPNRNLRNSARGRGKARPYCLLTSHIHTNHRDPHSKSNFCLHCKYLLIALPFEPPNFVRQSVVPAWIGIARSTNVASLAHVPSWLRPCLTSLFGRKR